MRMNPIATEHPTTTTNAIFPLFCPNFNCTGTINEINNAIKPNIIVHVINNSGILMSG